MQSHVLIKIIKENERGRSKQISRSNGKKPSSTARRTNVSSAKGITFSRLDLTTIYFSLYIFLYVAKLVTSKIRLSISICLHSPHFLPFYFY